MKPKLKAPGTKRLTLKCDGTLSSFAFKFNLRRYIVVNQKALVLHGGLPSDTTVTLKEIRELSRGPDGCSEEANWGKVRRCRLTLSTPR
jgi:hypothetical protein